MERLATACCGLDVHKQTVVACLVRPSTERSSTRETRTFGTTTQALEELRSWLQAAECTHVALESTGVYWKPIYHVLEGLCSVWVVNAQHIKNVPGRKTDVRDAEWLAELLQHGLVRPSFVPDRARAGTARPDAHPHNADRGTHGVGQSPPGGAGRCQHQAGRCGK